MKKCKIIVGLLLTLTCLLGTLMCVNVFADTPSQNTIPQKPDNAANILNYSKQIYTDNGSNIANWDGTFTILDNRASNTFVGFDLTDSGVKTTDSYVASIGSAAISISSGDIWSSVVIVYRGDVVNGPFYSFDINYQNADSGKGYVYCAKHYKEGGVWKSNANYGGGDLAYTAAAMNVTVVSTPSSADLFVNGTRICGIATEQWSDQNEITAFAALTPQFGIWANGRGIKAQDFDGYILPGQATTTTQASTTTTLAGSGETTTTTVAGSGETTTTNTEATTTTTTKPTAPTDLSTVPAMPSENGNLIKANTSFSTDRKDLFLYNKNNLKVEISGDAAAGYWDLSKSGLTSSDTYVFRTSFTITEPYDQWSGVAFQIRGDKNGKVYEISILQEAVYILDKDLVAGTYAAKYVDTVFTNVDAPYESGKEYTLEVVSGPKNMSVFIDGKGIFLNAALDEERAPLLGVANGKAKANLNNITLYNVVPDGSANDQTDTDADTDTDIDTDTDTDTENNPSTGVAIPAVAIFSLLGAAITTVYTTKRKQ